MNVDKVIDLSKDKNMVFAFMFSYLFTLFIIHKISRFLKVSNETNLIYF